MITILTTLNKTVRVFFKEAFKLNLFITKLTELLNGLVITNICVHSTNPVTLDFPQRLKLLFPTLCVINPYICSKLVLVNPKTELLSAALKNI